MLSLQYTTSLPIQGKQAMVVKEDKGDLAALLTLVPCMRYHLQAMGRDPEQQQSCNTFLGNSGTK